MNSEKTKAIFESVYNTRFIIKPKLEDTNKIIGTLQELCYEKAQELIGDTLESEIWLKRASILGKTLYDLSKIVVRNGSS